jgi:GrpB-like predicted nucleotidyltransferase (UPF0157 family)
MRLVFIEGISGVGKSTLTQKLCEKLNVMGYSSGCHIEFDFTNPIDFYCTAYFKQSEYDNLLAGFPEHRNIIEKNTITADDIRLVRYYNRETPLFSEPLSGILKKRELCFNPNTPILLNEFTRVYKLVWDNFAKNTSHEHIYLLFDGSLFHHPINDLIRNYDVSKEQAINHVNTLIEAAIPLNPIVIYLSCENTAKRLKKARECRKQTPPSDEYIQFWESRKKMDLAVMQQISIPYDVYDISLENWDTLLDTMVTYILESPEERRARIYPIVLQEYNPAWQEWYAEEKVRLEQLIGTENIVRINHYGSTSVPGLVAKPTVDILLEVKDDVDLKQIASLLPGNEYFCQWRYLPDDPLMFYKGYTPIGFAEKVFHIHVRYFGDWDELYFRDYLVAHTEIAAEYAALKSKLMQEFKHDRDGYTDAKGEFIRSVTEIARKRGNV